jgi:hypothetical protein
MSIYFEECAQINRLIESGDEDSAREELIRVLDKIHKTKSNPDELVNHLSRRLGFFHYIDPEYSIWEDRLVHEAFKVDTGEEEPKTLHKDQSQLLRMLLEGRDMAISAPTSFGKSFVIDSFIAIKQPATVVIIVPTIALMDEARRRLTKKFSSRYKIITTSEVPLAERNILIFPQERAFGYLDKLEEIDILIVDEFYKASGTFANKKSDERSLILLKAILELSKIAKQRYFLAPNITSLTESVFTQGMTFHEFKMSTVFLKTYEEYLDIKGSKEAKIEKKTIALKKLLAEGRKNGDTKTLIYAGRYPEVDRLINLVCESSDPHATDLLNQFSAWIRKNYSSEWELADLVTRRYGIHNGNLHRSLSQIQVKLFEVEDGLSGLISTSSIIEGVNTAAERVVVWHNRNGQPRLTSFDYKNLAGRGGRMFRYFVGHVHILAEPPPEEDAQITLDIPDKLLVSMDETEEGYHLTKEQVAVIIAYKQELEELMSSEQMKTLMARGFLASSDYDLAKSIVIALKADPDSWNQLVNLNSNDKRRWSNALYKILRIKRLHKNHVTLVDALILMASSWENGQAKTIEDAKSQGIPLDDFFKLERTISFGLATLIHDINSINREIFGSTVDISTFAAKAAHAFLPVLVYQLEEYGLPRIISRKIQNSGLIDLESDEKNIHEIISEFSHHGYEKISSIESLDDFDKFILDYFYEGVCRSY